MRGKESECALSNLRECLGMIGWRVAVIIAENILSG
jgi:hypothetical protein